MPRKLFRKIRDPKINEYKEIFNIFDKEGTGIISANDIIKMKEIFTYPISLNNIKKMIKEIDINGDGKLDFGKFVTFIQKQQDYIKEKDEENILESFKEDYLGSKRKREIISIDEVSNMLNCQNNIKDNVKNEENENIEIVNINCNKKKKKPNKVINDDNNTNDLNNKRTTEQTNKNEKINSSHSSKINKKENNKNTKKNHKKKKEGKKKNDEILSDKILIYKSNLPKDVICQIELKNNNNLSPIKIQNININTPCRQNTFVQRQPLSSISSKLISEFDYLNSINNINSGDVSFVSGLSLDLFNKQIDKTPQKALNKKSTNSLVNLYTQQMNDQQEKTEKKEDINKYILNKNNYSKKKIPNNNNDIKPLPSFKINTKVNDFCLNDNKIISYKKENIDDKNRLDYCINEGKTREEGKTINDKKSENTPNKDSKFLNQNIQILNNFIFEYKKKRREKINQISIEIPYSIIIEKNILNINKNNNSMNKKDIETKKDILCQRTPKFLDNKQFTIIEQKTEKKRIKTEIHKKSKSRKKDKNDKDKSIILKKVDIRMENLRKNQKKKAKIIEDETLDNAKDNKIDENEEKFLNIANIKFNCSNENNSKLRSKIIKNSILEEKTIKDETYLKETQNCGKNKNDNNNETEEKLATTELFKGFNYLFYQKCK